MPALSTNEIGSSPRVRGTRFPARSSGRRRRFIPACAGNTPRRFAGVCGGSVHPRVCGEHYSICPLSDIVVGSSPRVRGTPGFFCAGAKVSRFIPACAGNTTASMARRPACAVHPRVCGEHVLLWCRVWTESGSSPRVRGTLTGPRDGRYGYRFIPACAGNTACSGCSPRPMPVHPRVCGEHADNGSHDRSAPGSSPRVRGTLRVLRRIRR